MQVPLVSVVWNNNNNNNAQPHPTRYMRNYGGGELETLEAAEEATGTRPRCITHHHKDQIPILERDRVEE